jgi:hypothetical protein
MLGDTIAALKFGLSIWDSKEKTRYLDELLEIERRWLNEFKKGRPRKVNGVIEGYSSARLDELTIELRHFSSRIFAAAGVTNISTNM